MKHYHTKPRQVLAVQYMGKYGELPHEVRKNVVNHVEGGSCWIFTGLREIEVKPDDWIVLDGTRAFMCTREDFPRYYDEFVPEGNPYETYRDDATGMEGGTKSEAPDAAA